MTQMQILRPIGVVGVASTRHTLHPWYQELPPPPRVFVNNDEAIVLAPMRTMVIDGKPICTAFVALPWVRCRCDGTDHPVKVIVSVEPCGVDPHGAQMFWDTGVVRFHPGEDDDDGDGEEWMPDDDDSGVA